MSQSIYSFLSLILATLGGGWVFIITLALEFSAFLVALFLSIFKTLYTLKRRVWFFLTCFILLCFELALLSVQGLAELFYLSVAFTGIISLVIIVLPTKQVKIKEEQRSLARLIDSEIKRQDVPTAQFIEPTKKREEAQTAEQVNLQANRFELDFKHVKVVMDKLEYYPLSTADKKILKELEESIELAQSGEFSQTVKCKINDGLGALLKIMSKYGV